METLKHTMDNYNPEAIKYIIGIDFGHGETSANIIDLEDEDKVRVLPICGNLYKAINSSMCYDSKKDKWILHPNPDTIKRIIQKKNPDDLLNFNAYLKGPVKAGEHNNMKALNDSQKENFGKFIKLVYDQIYNVAGGKMNPRLIDGENRNFLLFVACPSGWEQNQAEAFLEFIRNLGIPCEQVVKESNAAWMCYRPKTIEQQEKANVLVIDLGSSTLDFTWVNSTGDTIHNGYENGASNVEKKLFRYIYENSDCAKKAFGTALAIILDKDIVEVLLTYILRQKKEKYFNDVAQYPDDEDIELENINMSELFYEANGVFGLDNEQLDKEKVNEIIMDYIGDLQKDFEEFREKYNVETKNIILTGGASNMDFVMPLVKEVFKCENINKDPDYSYSISTGIAKYGVLIYKSKTPETKINQITKTWGNEKWLEGHIADTVTPLVRELFTKKITSIFKQWQEGEITLDMDHTLDEYNNEILESVKNDDARIIKIWEKVTSNTNYGNGYASIHALLRSIVDCIDENMRNSFIKEARELLISNLKNDIEKDLYDYIHVFFKDEKKENLYKYINVDLSRIKYTLNISHETILNLLRQMTEKAFEIIDENDYFPSTIFTYNNHREDGSGKYSNERKGYFENFGNDFKNFANSVEIELEAGGKTSKAIAEKVRDKIEGFKDICVNAVK